MNEIDQLVLFDYAQLDAPTRGFVEQRTEEIRALGKRMAVDIIGIGQRLTEIKARLGHGHFGKWLEYEFGWSATNAWRFMKVAEAFKSSKLEDLTIEASALYLLAAPSTPQEAREEAIEQAEEGEEITHAKAKEIVDEYKDQDEILEPEPERFVCPDCGEIFQGEVWHCAYCHSHWGIDQGRCLGCDHTPAKEREKKALALLEADAPDLLEQVRDGEKTIPQAKRELTRRQKADPPPFPDDKYRVWYADPPWEYGNSGVIGETDNYGHVERHYPSMSIAELCEIGPEIKARCLPDAVLFLWVTSPLLEECFPVIQAWGFKYKTSFVWDKVRHNYGHYNSVRHEFLLVCTRGSCTPDVQKLFDSVQSIERTDKHSEKPGEFRQIIQTLYPHGQRIELFARVTVDGWDSWGNEGIREY